MRWTELMGQGVGVAEGKSVGRRAGEETTQSPVSVVGGSPSSRETAMPSGRVSVGEEGESVLLEEAAGVAGGGGGFSCTRNGGAEGGTGMPSGGERSSAPRARPRIWPPPHTAQILLGKKGQSRSASAREACAPRETADEISRTAIVSDEVGRRAVATDSVDNGSDAVNCGKCEICGEQCQHHRGGGGQDDKPEGEEQSARA